MADTNPTTSNETPAEQNGEFQIQRIFIKDLSFEAPQSPSVFQQEWKPNLELQIQTSSNKLAEDTFEVILKITTTVKVEEKVAFVAEVQQAGIFVVKAFTQEQIDAILGGTCPGILFPYARETLSDVVIRGTFPPLYLAPINFDAMYLQHKDQKQTSGTNGQQDGKIIV